MTNTERESAEHEYCVTCERVTETHEADDTPYCSRCGSVR